MLRGETVQVRVGRGAKCRKVRGSARVRVEDPDLVALLHEPSGDASAHLPEADDCDAFVHDCPEMS